MSVLYYILIFFAMVVALFVIKLVVDCVNGKMLEDYKDMQENSEESDAKERKKSHYIVSAKCEGGFSTLFFYEKIVPGNT